MYIVDAFFVHSFVLMWFVLWFNRICRVTATIKVFLKSFFDDRDRRSRFIDVSKKTRDAIENAGYCAGEIATNNYSSPFRPGIPRSPPGRGWSEIWRYHARYPAGCSCRAAGGPWGLPGAQNPFLLDLLSFSWLSKRIILYKNRDAIERIRVF